MSHISKRFSILFFFFTRSNAFIFSYLFCPSFSLFISFSCISRHLQYELSFLEPASCLLFLSFFKTVSRLILLLTQHASKKIILQGRWGENWRKRVFHDDRDDKVKEMNETVSHIRTWGTFVAQKVKKRRNGQEENVRNTSSFPWQGTTDERKQDSKGNHSNANIRWVDGNEREKKEGKDSKKGLKSKTLSIKSKQQEIKGNERKNPSFLISRKRRRKRRRHTTQSL